jgi:hypothetical protein
MKCIRGPRWAALALALAATVPAADTLTGRTLERGEPLAGVEIRVIDPASRVMLGQDMSRRDGTFSVTYPGGPVDIGAFKSDYATVWLKGVRPGKGDAPLSIDLNPRALVDGSPPASGGCD